MPVPPPITHNPLRLTLFSVFLYMLSGVNILHQGRDHYDFHLRLVIYWSGWCYLRVAS